MKTNIRNVVVLWVVLIGLTMSLPLKAEAQTLQPRLLWEKTMKFKVYSAKMASVSGDVLVNVGGEIILLDKNGKEVFHWGPRVDRQPKGEVHISDDGSVMLFETAFTESYIGQKNLPGAWDWDNRIHYSTRKGKELWNKKIGGGGVELSPDGKMVVNYAGGGEGKDLNVYDPQGKILWTFETDFVDGFSFSPDSQYFGFNSMSKTTSNGHYLTDKSGNVLWRKDILIVNSPTASDMADMAKYVTIEPWVGENQVGKVFKVFDKQGNLVFDGNARVSSDGNRLLIPYPDRTVILSLPDKAVIKEYPFAVDKFFSQDGRFLLTVPLAGRNSFRIYDTLEQVGSEISLPGTVSFYRITKDGKYMLIVVDGNKILYYQLY